MCKYTESATTLARVKIANNRIKAFAVARSDRHKAAAVYAKR